LYAAGLNHLGGVLGATAAMIITKLGGSIALEHVLVLVLSLPLVKSCIAFFCCCFWVKKPCFQENLVKSFGSAMVLCLPRHTLVEDFLA